MKKNIGLHDRLFRLAIAIGLLALAWVYSSWLLLAAALFTFYEAAASWCVLYALLGKSSCPVAVGPSSSFRRLMTPATSTVAEVNGQKLYYELYGKGEPLLMIAGFTCNALIWSLSLRRLAEKHQVILFDNRGAGRSSDPDSPYTIDDLADDAAALLDYLKIDKAHILGHSMGGAIAQSLAYRYPEKVNKLILACTSSNFTERCNHIQGYILGLMDKGYPREMQVDAILPWVYSNAFLGNESTINQIKQILINEPYRQSINGFKRQFGALQSFDSREWLSQITAPTLVIHGTEDALCILDHEALLKSLPTAEEYAFQNMGHLPHIEQPEKFANVINNFL